MDDGAVEGVIRDKIEKYFMNISAEEEEEEGRQAGDESMR